MSSNQVTLMLIRVLFFFNYTLGKLMLPVQTLGDNVLPQLIKSLKLPNATNQYYGEKMARLHFL
ncbi:MAG: hypothetical protein AAGM46_14480 [Cyanobacteria bacterium J06582_2]